MLKEIRNVRRAYKLLQTESTMDTLSALLILGVLFGPILAKAYSSRQKR